MPTVSALRPTRREGRVSVHLDGRFVFAVEASFVVRHGLFVGLELSDEQCAALGVDAGADRVLTDAYRLLAHRARSRTELVGRLRAKGYDEQAVGATLERLQGDGLIDDRAFAAAFVADKRRLSGWGAGRIAGELARLGVEAAIVEAALPQSDETRGRPSSRLASAPTSSWCDAATPRPSPTRSYGSGLPAQPIDSRFLTTLQSTMSSLLTDLCTYLWRLKAMHSGPDGRPVERAT